MTVVSGSSGIYTFVEATSAETIANSMGTFSNTAPSPTGYYTTEIKYTKTWEHPIALNAIADALTRLDPEDVKKLIYILETNARSLEDHLESAYLKNSGGTMYGDTIFGGSVSLLGNVYVKGSPLITMTVPPGMIMAWGGDDYPVDGVPGYLLCDGQEYETAVYKNLYAVIGDVYGSSGPGYFNVPDLTAEYAPYNNISGWYVIKT